MLKLLKKDRASSSARRNVAVAAKDFSEGTAETTNDLDSSVRSMSDFDLSKVAYDADSSIRSLPLVREETTALPPSDNAEKSESVVKQQRIRSNSDGTPSTYTDPDRPNSLVNKQKRVSWSSIELYSHAVSLGDNPACSAGPPLCIGNELLYKDTLTVEDFETQRPERREKQEMCLSRLDREDWLRSVGFGRADFRQAEEEIRRVKKTREANAKPSLWDKLRSGSGGSKRFVASSTRRGSPV